MNDNGDWHLREQLMGISISLLLVIFSLGSFAIYSLLYLSKEWAIAAICGILVVVPIIASAGYSHGKTIAFGTSENYTHDGLSIVFRAFVIIGLVIALAALMLSSTATSSAATTLNARDLLKVCTTAEMHWVNFCNGYFQSVHDQGALKREICAPEGTTRTQLVETFQNGATAVLDRDPTLGSAPGITVAISILGQAYPCKPS